MTVNLTGVKTRKTSADVFKSAIQRKVSTFSALHAWKRNCTGNDNVAKDPASTESELKPNTAAKEENGRTAKPPRITLSVHKMTPIPSIELDDYTPEQTNGVANGEKSEDLSAGPSSGLQSVEKTQSWPEMSIGSAQGRGILKKNSVVEWPPEMVEEHPVEGESGEREVANTSASVAVGETGEPKKEVLLGRTVKFDMPSFDSQTSDEIPEIIVEVVTEMAKSESNSKVLASDSEQVEHIEHDDSSKDDVCEKSSERYCSEGEISDTLKEAIRFMKEIEEDVKSTRVAEEEEDKELEQLQQERKVLRKDLKTILRAILINNSALKKQGFDLQEVAFEERDNVEEEENFEETVENVEEGVRHTLVLPRSKILPCTTCWSAPEKQISEDSKVLKRRHSCPSSLTTCCHSWAEEKEEAAFAQTFLCRFREDEDFEDEGLGLGIVASQLPLLQDTAILGPEPSWQQDVDQIRSPPSDLRLCSAESMENVACWDFEGMARALLEARETHMV